jgi:hypothetical protein
MHFGGGGEQANLQGGDYSRAVKQGMTINGSWINKL